MKAVENWFTRSQENWKPHDRTYFKSFSNMCNEEEKDLISSQESVIKNYHKGGYLFLDTKKLLTTVSNYKSNKAQLLKTLLIASLLSWFEECGCSINSLRAHFVLQSNYLWHKSNPHYIIFLLAMIQPVTAKMSDDVKQKAWMLLEEKELRSKLIYLCV